MTEMSLRNIDSFTHQEIFDFVAEKLIAQGTRSVIKNSKINGGVRCSYHNEACDMNGPKCAVGHILSEQEHREVDRLDLNGLGVHTLVERLGYRADIKYDTIRFLGDLQAAHDNCYGTSSFSKDFVEHMREKADRWYLGTAKLDELFPESDD